jgi:DNA-directed RNA polymerase alpha subunit
LVRKLAGARPGNWLGRSLIENVRFSNRIRNALNAAGVKTIGDIREASGLNIMRAITAWG